MEEVGAEEAVVVLGQLVVGWRPAGASSSVPPLQHIHKQLSKEPVLIPVIHKLTFL